jgi:hypothetical protein
MIFYSSGGRESDGLDMVVDGGGVDLVLQFCLEKECDGKKHCRKMKQR